MAFIKEPSGHFRVAMRTGQGDRVEHCGGTVTSNPGGGEQSVAPEPVESVATEPAGGIKTSDATVVLATHDLDRWPFLVAAVESLLAGPNQPNHVVICVDQNEELCERVRATWPQVTTALNKCGRGASGARNTGAERAETPFIAFLDDDIRARDGWLSRLLEPFTDPAVVGTGGGVVAHWQAGRPGWFPEEFDWVVGASYRGMPTVRSPVRNVWAENMAVRTEVFHAVGGFRSGFGKVGNRSSPEDTDLCIRMSAHVAGAQWVYVPDAVAEHQVPVGRARLSFFLRRNYLEGRGKVEMAHLLGRQETLQDERDYLRRTLPAGVRAELKTAARRRELSGLLKASAIVAGVLAAGVGAVAECTVRRG
jgi:glucosyl-dolichyl phosphate glucuronosyltransferase